LLDIKIALFLFFTRQGSVKVVMPIISKDLCDGKVNDLLSDFDTRSEATSARAVLLLQRLGFATETDIGSTILHSSIRETVLLLLGNRERVSAGSRNWFSPLHLTALDGREPTPIYLARPDAAAAAERVGAALRGALRQVCEELQWELENHVPFGAELARWLDSKGLHDCKTLCAMAGIDSLRRLAHPRALPLVAWAAGSDGPLAAGGGAGDARLAALAAAAAGLAGDARALPLHRRLQGYRDRQANGLVALMTPNAIETGMLSAQTQACCAAMGLALMLFGSYQLQFCLHYDTRCVHPPGAACGLKSVARR
jgi:hypothetical protein